MCITTVIYYMEFTERYNDLMPKHTILVILPFTNSFPEYSVLDSIISTRDFETKKKRFKIFIV